MKTLVIFLVSLLYYPSASQKGVLINKFTLGKFTYSIYKEQSYSHDDDWNSNFFVVYKLGKQKHLCSAYIDAVRNDSTFIKGRYSLYNDRIEFTECYYYYKNNPVSIDSIKNTFYPNKNGDLVLKKSVEFKNGKKKETKY